MIVISDGYEINFQGAIAAFKFDEIDSAISAYHGVTALKAVDVIAEFETEYIFVEIKEYNTPEELDESMGGDGDDREIRHDKFNRLKNYLKYKYRDSLLYRFAEQKVDKPIHYICLLNFDNALNLKMAKNLTSELPVGIKSTRWKHELSKSCNALNLKMWNELFPRWPATRI